MPKIYIDAGHGGNSIGASYKGRLEQDDCLRLALAVGKLVEAQGVTVKYSRTADVNPDLTGRCKEANTWGADYFISIHRNAFKPEQAQGVEAYVYSKCIKGGETYNKAKNIVDDVCAATGFRNRGVALGAPSYTDFAVNRVTKMDSCLLECGFIDSTADNRIFDAKFNEMSTSIAKGLCAAVGVKYSEKPAPDQPKPEQPDSDGGVYRVQIGAFKNRQNAEGYAEKAIQAGFQAIVIPEYEGETVLYRVQCGAFSVRQNAINYAAKLEDAGFPAIIKESKTP